MELNWIRRCAVNKTYQTSVDQNKGDCLRACIASILELDINQVPNFVMYNEVDFSRMLFHFLLFFGITFNTIATYKINKYGCFGDRYIAIVKSKTFKELNHAVIIDKNFNVIHDPNPNKNYTGKTITKDEFIGYYLMQNISDRYVKVV